MLRTGMLGCANPVLMKANDTTKVTALKEAQKSRNPHFTGQGENI